MEEWFLKKVFRKGARSYRPITHLPVYGKVLEGIMVRRMRRQSDFRKGKSIIDAWYHVKDVIRRSNKKYALGIFIDFKGAFDNLKWGKVISIGKRAFIEKEVSRGCPQSSICGSHVWNLMMDTHSSPLTGLWVCGLLLIVEGDSRLMIELIGCRNVEIASNCSPNVGVEISTSKKVMMMLKGTLAKSRPVKLNGKGVQIVY